MLYMLLSSKKRESEKNIMFEHPSGACWLYEVYSVSAQEQEEEVEEKRSNLEGDLVAKSKKSVYTSFGSFSCPSPLK